MSTETLLLVCLTLTYGFRLYLDSKSQKRQQAMLLAMQLSQNTWFQALSYKYAEDERDFLSVKNSLKKQYEILESIKQKTSKIYVHSIKDETAKKILDEILEEMSDLSKSAQDLQKETPENNVTNLRKLSKNFRDKP